MRTLIIALSLLVLCGFPATAKDGGESKQGDERQEKTRSNEKEKATDTGKDGETLPIGVSLAGPDGPIPLPRRESLPPGASTIGDGPRPETGTARVRVIPELPPPPEIPEVVVSSDPTLPEAPAPISADEADASSPPRLGIGPTVGEQIDVFGQGIIPAAKPIGGSSPWEPTSAWEKGDPANPYPWNPAKWAKPSIDPEWTPTESFPVRDENNPYPWNPSRWAEPSIDFDWYPTDSWGRIVDIPEVTTESGAAADVESETEEGGSEESD